MDFIKLYEELSVLDEELFDEATKEFGRWKKAFANLVYTGAYAAESPDGKKTTIAYLDNDDSIGAFKSNNDNALENIEKLFRSKIKYLQKLLIDITNHGVVDDARRSAKDVKAEIKSCEDVLDTCKAFKAAKYQIYTDTDHIETAEETANEAIKRLDAIDMDSLDDTAKEAVEKLKSYGLSFDTKYIKGKDNRYWQMPCVLHHINGVHTDNAKIKPVTPDKIPLIVKPADKDIKDIEKLGNYVLIEAKTPEEANNAHLLVHALGIIQHLAAGSKDQGFKDMMEYLKKLPIKAIFYYVSNFGVIKATNLSGFLEATDRCGYEKTPLQELADGAPEKAVYDDGKAE